MTGFRVLGALRFQGLKGVKGLGFRVSGFWFTLYGSSMPAFWIKGSGLRVKS